MYYDQKNKTIYIGKDLIEFMHEFVDYENKFSCYFSQSCFSFCKAKTQDFMK